MLPPHEYQLQGWQDDNQQRGGIMISLGWGSGTVVNTFAWPSAKTLSSIPSTTKQKQIPLRFKDTVCGTQNDPEMNNNIYSTLF